MIKAVLDQRGQVREVRTPQQLAARAERHRAFVGNGARPDPRNPGHSIPPYEPVRDR